MPCCVGCIVVVHMSCHRGINFCCCCCLQCLFFIFSSKLPKGYVVDSVTEDMIGLLTARWRYKATQPQNIIMKTLKWGFPSVCVYNEQGIPVSWALQKYYGFVANLYTEEGYRRKGIGRYVLASITRQMLQSGQIAYAAVDKENGVSINMFEKMGYRRCPETMDFSWAWFSSQPIV